MTKTLQKLALNSNRVKPTILNQHPKVLRFSTRIKLANERILKTNRIRDIAIHSDPTTKFIWDLDETTFRHEQTLGGRWWVHEFTQRLIQQGVEHKAAFDEVLKTFHAVQEHTKVVPMEDCTVELNKQIKREAFGLLALTARGEENRASTERQLSDIEVEFPQGIIFARGTKNKAPSLKVYFSEQEILPKRIVYIDDKMEPVLEVKAVVEEFGMEFIGFHYTRMDELEQSFDYRVAEIQHELFAAGKGKLISDEEVRTLLAQKQPGLRFGQ